MTGLEKEIDNSLNQAQIFLENAFLSIENCDKEIISGWPHYLGKKRVTEFGGTSSGLSGLYCLGFSDNSMIRKSQKALEWLIDKQNSDGAWRSSGSYNCETTAGILSELYQYNKLSDESVRNASKYILSCYDDAGYFKATPETTSIPHIFITYRAVKALAIKSTGELSSEMKLKIINWIESSKALDDKWGMTSRCKRGTAAHTAFALLILLYCEMPVNAVRAKYSNQIKWLKSQISACGCAYETEKVEVDIGSDYYGTVYQTFVISHFVGPLLSMLFNMLGEVAAEMNAIINIMRYQISGGWAVSKDNITIWATQQAVYELNRFKKTKVDKLNIIQRFFYRIPYGASKLVITLVIIAAAAWFMFDPAYREEAIIALALGVFPWLFKRSYISAGR